MADLETFLGRVRDRHPDGPMFLFAHSMGGTIAATFAITRRADLQGLILDHLQIALLFRVVGIYEKV